MCSSPWSFNSWPLPLLRAVAYIHVCICTYFPLFSFLVLPGFMLSGTLAHTLLLKGLIHRPDGAWHCFSKERNRYPAAHRAGAVIFSPCLHPIEKPRWAEGEKGESRREDTKRGTWGRGDQPTKTNARLHARDEKRVLVPGCNGKGDKPSACLMHVKSA